MKAGKLVAELYPQDDAGIATLGLIHLIFGDREEAQTMLRKALSLNAEGLASAGGLNGTAYQLAGAGKADQGIEVLKLAVELHPKVANLYDSLGEFYVNKGDKQKALEYYRKAIEVDPNYPNAEAARAIVSKLSS